MQLCNRYKGNFKQGMRDGYGVFFYSTGARYAGQWAANVKEGEGTFTFEDGSVYEGLFHNDRCARCSLGLLPPSCAPPQVFVASTSPKCFAVNIHEQKTVSGEGGGEGFACRLVPRAHDAPVCCTAACMTEASNKCTPLSFGLVPPRVQNHLSIDRVSYPHACVWCGAAWGLPRRCRWSRARGL